YLKLPVPFPRTRPAEPSSWAWLREAWERCEQKERSAIRRVIHSSRSSLDHLRATRDQALASAERLSTTASAHLSMTTERAWSALWDTTAEYPLPTLAGATLLFAGVVGWAPKRTFLFALAAGYAMRRSIATQHGEQLADLSCSLSETCRCACS
ncbi:MAG: hypothetical protein SGPRY_003121, partial [Prymnesium sp.]